MGNIFAASEIVEIGIQIEQNGRDFYLAVAGKSRDEKAAKIFRFLAAEEDKHIAAFQKLLEQTKDYQPAETYPGEYYEYMKALAGEHVFTQKDTGRLAAQSAQGDKEAIELAVGFEKDSIIFYEGMKKIVPGSGLKVVDSLIAQEQGHLRQLVELKGAI